MQLHNGRCVFSPCGRYRYCLSWLLEPAPAVVREVCFVLCNPPMGDALRLDLTARKLLGWAGPWGFNAVRILNLFAWRAGEPMGLASVRDPVGPENDRWLETARGAACRVAAWGSPGWSSRLGLQRVRARVVFRRLACFGPVSCLGVCRDGFARHPLFVHRMPVLRTYSPAASALK